jgi:hypothetical protein
MNLDDASGVEGEWRDANAPHSAAVAGFLKMAGEIYFPFLLANAKAIEKGEPTFSVALRGKTYSQGAFRYQQRCLWDLREAYRRLDATAKAKIDPMLEAAACIASLQV